jgi:hypothetical protein
VMRTLDRKQGRNPDAEEGRREGDVARA